MKLNHDCVREILLELEEKLTFDDDLHLQQIKELDTCKEHGEEETLYTILKLIEANYLVGNTFYSGDELYHLSVSSITWNGHEFLDSVRSSEIWKETKNRVKAFSSVSIGVLTEVAKDQIKQKLFGTN